MILPTNLLWADAELMFYPSLKIILYLQYFFYQRYFRSFSNVRDSVNNNSFLESNSKNIFKDTNFPHVSYLMFFGQIIYRLILQTNVLIILICLSNIIFLKTEIFFLVGCVI